MWREVVTLRWSHAGFMWALGAVAGALRRRLRAPRQKVERCSHKPGGAGLLGAPEAGQRPGRTLHCSLQREHGAAHTLNVDL